jgi:hypothetical protein
VTISCILLIQSRPNLFRDRHYVLMSSPNPQISAIEEAVELLQRLQPEDIKPYLKQLNAIVDRCREKGTEKGTKRKRTTDKKAEKIKGVLNTIEKELNEDIKSRIQQNPSDWIGHISQDKDARITTSDGSELQLTPHGRYEICLARRSLAIEYRLWSSTQPKNKHFSSRSAWSRGAAESARDAESVRKTSEHGERILNFESKLGPGIALYIAEITWMGVDPTELNEVLENLCSTSSEATREITNSEAAKRFVHRTQEGYHNRLKLSHLNVPPALPSIPQQDQPQLFEDSAIQGQEAAEIMEEPFNLGDSNSEFLADIQLNSHYWIDESVLLLNNTFFQTT